MTQYDINLSKRFMFRKYTMGHCLIGKWNQLGKQTRMSGLISKKVSMFQTENKEIEHIVYKPSWVIWLMKDIWRSYTKMLAWLLNSSPSAIVKKSIEDAGFKLSIEIEVYKPMQLKSLLHLPMGMCKKCNDCCQTSDRVKNLYQVIIVLLESEKASPTHN